MESTAFMNRITMLQHFECKAQNSDQNMAGMFAHNMSRKFEKKNSAFYSFLLTLSMECLNHSEVSCFFVQNSSYIALLNYRGLCIVFSFISSRLCSE